jgi:hypothetical protein
MIIDWKGLISKFKWPIVGALIVVVGLIAYGCHKDKTQPVTGMSQQQAETVQGVKLAADNAQVPMLQSQLEEAKAEIAALKNKKPETVIKTVPVEVIKTVEVERKKSGANFAILTDPASPDKPLDLNEVAKLPEGTTVNLNQYNVHAYRSLLRQIEIAPDWEQLAQGKFKVDSAGYGVAKKISKSGKYLGLKAQYDFDDKKGKLLTTYTY